MAAVAPSSAMSVQLPDLDDLMEVYSDQGYPTDDIDIDFDQQDKPPSVDDEPMLEDSKSDAGTLQDAVSVATHDEAMLDDLDANDAPVDLNGTLVDDDGMMDDDDDLTVRPDDDELLDFTDLDQPDDLQNQPEPDSIDFAAADHNTAPSQLVVHVSPPAETTVTTAGSSRADTLGQSDSVVEILHDDHVRVHDLVNDTEDAPAAVTAQVSESADPEKEPTETALPENNNLGSTPVQEIDHVEPCEKTGNNVVADDHVQIEDGEMSTLTGLHPVIVLWGTREIALFPFKGEQDQGNSLLEDENLVNASLGDLLRACRNALAEDLSEKDELVASIQELNLYTTEEASSAFTASLSDLLSVYLQLYRNDGDEHPPPLYLLLDTNPRFANQLAYLSQHVAQGMGISHLVALSEDSSEGVADDAQPDLSGSLGDGDGDNDPLGLPSTGDKAFVVEGGEASGPDQEVQAEHNEEASQNEEVTDGGLTEVTILQEQGLQSSTDDHAGDKTAADGERVVGTVEASADNMVDSLLPVFNGTEAESNKIDNVETRPEHTLPSDDLPTTQSQPDTHLTSRKDKGSVLSASGDGTQEEIHEDATDVLDFAQQDDNASATAADNEAPAIADQVENGANVSADLLDVEEDQETQQEPNIMAQVEFEPMSNDAKPSASSDVAPIAQASGNQPDPDIIDFSDDELDNEPSAPVASAIDSATLKRSRDEDDARQENGTEQTPKKHRSS